MGLLPKVRNLVQNTYASSMSTYERVPNIEDDACSRPDHGRQQDPAIALPQPFGTQWQVAIVFFLFTSHYSINRGRHLCIQSPMPVWGALKRRQN